MRVAIILAILVVAVFAQTKPIWPTAASASIFVEGWSDVPEERHFLRWFYDEAAKKERVEGPQRHLGELYWTETLLDTTLAKEWFVVHQPGLVICYVGKTNRTLPHPDFTQARFVGKAEINYRVVDHWIERRENRDFSQIYDRVDNGEIVRIDIDDPRRDHAVSFHFHEFDAGTQDPSLWVLSPEIIAICNEVPNMDEFHFEHKTKQLLFQ